MKPIFCTETSVQISRNKLVLATHPSIEHFAPVCEDTLTRIPSKEILPTSRMEDQAGLNFYYGHASWLPTGGYSTEGVSLGGFIFSISKETAEKYLPDIWAKFAGSFSTKPAAAA